MVFIPTNAGGNLIHSSSLISRGGALCDPEEGSCGSRKAKRRGDLSSLFWRRHSRARQITHHPVHTVPINPTLANSAGSSMLIEYELTPKERELCAGQLSTKPHGRFPLDFDTGRRANRNEGVKCLQMKPHLRCQPKTQYTRLRKISEGISYSQ